MASINSTGDEELLKALEHLKATVIECYAGIKERINQPPSEVGD